MVSDAPAQVTLPADQEAPSAAAQVVALPLPASVADGAPAPVIETPPASEPVTTEPDYSTAEGIRKAAEANEALRNYLERERLNAENTARQRVEAEMRRNQGSNERAQQYQEDLLRRIQAGEDPAELAKQTPLYVKANEDYARAEVLKALTQQAIDLASPDEQSALRALLDEAGSADAVTKITASTLDALAKRIERQAREALTLDTLPKDSRLYQEIQEYIRREAETEMNAREVERNAVTPGPRTPTGGSADQMTKERLNNMTSGERLAYLATLTDEQRALAWDLVMT